MIGDDSEYGGQMKIISFIEQPYVFKRILKHLDLWEDGSS